MRQGIFFLMAKGTLVVCGTWSHHLVIRSHVQDFHPLTEQKDHDGGPSRSLLDPYYCLWANNSRTPAVDQSSVCFPVLTLKTLLHSRVLSQSLCYQQGRLGLQRLISTGSQTGQWRSLEGRKSNLHPARGCQLLTASSKWSVKSLSQTSRLSASDRFVFWALGK